MVFFPGQLHCIGFFDSQRSVPDQKHNQGFGSDNGNIKAEAGNFSDRQFVINGKRQLVMYRDGDCRAVADAQAGCRQFCEDPDFLQIINADFFQDLVSKGTFKPLKLLVVRGFDFGANMVGDYEKIRRQAPPVAQPDQEQGR